MHTPKGKWLWITCVIVHCVAAHGQVTSGAQNGQQSAATSPVQTLQALVASLPQNASRTAFLAVVGLDLQENVPRAITGEHPDGSKSLSLIFANKKLEFDVSTGELLWYIVTSDEDHVETLLKQDALSESQAKSKAEELLDRIGLKANVSDARAKIEGVSPGRKEDYTHARWQVIFQRSYQGYKYIKPVVAITLSARNGDVVAFVNHPSVAPKTLETKISKETAIEKAMQYVKDNVFTGHNIRPVLNEASVAQFIVVLSKEETLGKNLPHEDVARLVWWIPIAGSDGTPHIVHVDCGTGEVIGLD